MSTGLQALALGLLFAISGVAPARAVPKTIGPGSCGLSSVPCHQKENGWWKNDKHYGSVQALYDNQDRVNKIAGLMKIAAKNVFTDRRCVKCHGTVITGKEADGAEDGVSCESCHGPGSDYKEPHQKGKYAAGIKLGLTRLKELPVRAQTCVACHYVTDQKLLSATHKSGVDFSYVSGIKQVGKQGTHWKRAITSTDTDPGPFKAEIGNRGPVPIVDPPPAVGQPTAAAAEGGAVRVVTRIVEVGARLRPIGPIEATFPALSDTASVQEILLAVKKRLEQIYKAQKAAP